jgi:hypothetical protein
MMDEQEHAGASDNPADATSLSAFRSSGRPLKASKKVLENRLGSGPLPLNAQRKQARSKVTLFHPHTDEKLSTPPPTQLES